MQETNYSKFQTFKLIILYDRAKAFCNPGWTCTLLAGNVVTWATMDSHALPTAAGSPAAFFKQRTSSHGDVARLRGVPFQSFGDRIVELRDCCFRLFQGMTNYRTPQHTNTGGPPICLLCKQTYICNHQICNLIVQTCAMEPEPFPFQPIQRYADAGTF